ncbi:hypothetical protein ACTMU2_18055 [Cupriavidus basilensis]
MQLDGAEVQALEPKADAIGVGRTQGTILAQRVADIIEIGYSLVHVVLVRFVSGRFAWLQLPNRADRPSPVNYFSNVFTIVPGGVAPHIKKAGQPGQVSSDFDASNRPGSYLAQHFCQFLLAVAQFSRVDNVSGVDLTVGQVDQFNSGIGEHPTGSQKERRRTNILLVRRPCMTRLYSPEGSNSIAHQYFIQPYFDAVCLERDKQSLGRFDRSTRPGLQEIGQHSLRQTAEIVNVTMLVSGALLDQCSFQPVFPVDKPECFLPRPQPEVNPS